MSEPAEQPRRSGIFSISPISTERIHILIVEDEVSMADWLTSCMGDIRASFPLAVIETAKTWKEAKAIIFGEPPPTIVLLDLTMPDSDSMHTLSQVPLIEGRSALVIVTGRTKEEVDRILGAHTVEILQKGPSMTARSIIAGMLNAMKSKRAVAREDRFAALDAIVRELHAKGYATHSQTT